jgi:biopolymer transport protein ExbB/TolQ
MKFFLEMGTFLYPLIIFTLLALYNAIRHGGTVIGKNVKEKDITSMGIDSIIFWGVVTLTTGILGQILGIYTALRAISAAADISPTIIMNGFAISFLTTIYGFYVFLVSALIWYFLKRRLKSIISEKK